MNFGYENCTQKISFTFIHTGIRRPMYSGNKFFKKTGCLKFGNIENSQDNAGAILLK